MAVAQKDDNNINTLLGTLDSDGLTPTLIKINPTTHILSTLDGTSGSDNGNDIANRDDNQVPVMMAVSKDDGTTPVFLYADSNGNLLIDST